VILFPFVVIIAVGNERPSGSVQALRASSAYTTMFGSDQTNFILLVAREFHRGVTAIINDDDFEVFHVLQPNAVNRPSEALVPVVCANNDAEQGEGRRSHPE